MAEEVGRLSAVFNVDLKPLDRGLRQASKMLSQFEGRHGDDTDVELELKGLRGFQSGLQQAARSVSKLDGEDATVEIKTTGVHGAVTNFAAIERARKDLNGKSATVRVGERGAASTDAALSGVVAAANRANGQDVHIDVKETGSGQATVGLGMLGGAMLGVGAAAAAMDNGLSLGKVRILAIGGIAVTAAALFTPLLGGLASLGALAAGAAGGIGLLAAAFAPTIIALANHEEATKKVTTEQQAYTQAIRTVELEEAALRSARDQLTQANGELERAQIDLNRALEDEPLNQEEATLNLADARDRASDATREYNEAVAEYGAGSEEATDAARRMQRAELDLQKTERETMRVRSDGSSQLQSATDQHQSAMQGVEQAALRVQQQEQSLADATMKAAQAQLELAKAGEESGARLTASQQALLDKLGILKGQFSTAFGPATEGMNRLATQVLDFTGRALPALGAAATDTMRTFGAAINAAMSNFSSGPAVAAMQTVLAGMAPIIGSLTIALSDLSLGLIGIFAAAMPSAIALAEHIAGIAAAFSEWALSAEGASQVTAAIAAATPVFQALWDMVMQVGGALFRFGVTNAPAIATAIGMISGAVTAVINGFSWLVETLGPVVLVFAALAPVVIGVMVIIGSLATAFMALMPIVTGVGAALMFLTGPVGGIILVVAALAAGIHFLYQRFEIVRTVVNAVGRFLATVGKALFKTFFAAITGDTRFFANLWETAWGAVKGVATTAANGIKAAVGAVWDWLKSATAAVGDAVVSAWQALGAGVTAAREAMQAGIRKGWEWIKSFSLGLFNAVKDGVIAIWENFVRGVTVIREGFQAGIRRGWEWVRDFSIGLYEGVRDRLVSIWQNLGDKITSIRERFQSGIRRGFEWIRDFAGGIWDEIGKRIVSSFSSAINTARKWLGGLMTAVGNVLDAFGMDELAAGAKDRATKLNTPLAFARGGVYNADRGGVAGPGRMGVVGEAGDNEAIVNLNRKTPESQRAFRAAANSPNAPREHRSQAPRSGGPKIGNESLARKNAGSGPGMRQSYFGPATYTLVKPLKDIADKIAAKYGTPWNSYTNHPPGASPQPYWRERSVDWWGGGGRGDPIGSVWTSVANDAASMLGGNLEYMLTPSNDPAGHWDHIHVSAFIGQEGLGTATGSGGGTGGGFDWMGTITSGLANIATPDIGLGIIGEGFAGFGKSLIGKAKDWLIEKAKSFFGSLIDRGGPLPGGTSPSGLTLGEAVAQGGWPAHLQKTAIGVAWEESTANASAQNPSGARGLFQIMPGTASDVGADYEKLYDPVYNSAAGVKVYNAQGWGAWVAHPPSYDSMSRGNEPVTGYARGGIVPGPTGMAQLIRAHGGERILPIGLTDSFDRLAESIELWSAKDGGATATVRDVATNGLSERVEKRLEKMEEVLERQLKKMMTAETLADSQIRAVKRAIAGGATNAELDHIISEALS